MRGRLFVDWRFMRSWSRCSFIVAMFFGRLFVIKFTPKPGHDVKCPFLMALMIVDGVGLKSAPNMYCARSLFF